MKRLLCVTPAFPPNNAADCHRVRMALPYFQENGWEVEVLAVRPEFVETVHETELVKTIPPEIKVHRVFALPQRLTRLFGFGGLGLRAGFHLQKEGAKLLNEGDFNAVYFSSTVFSTFPMGTVWKKKFGVPFFVDYQDPWWSDYYKGRRQRPPGGWLKYGLVQCNARWQEGRVVREAAGVTCVSPAYVEMLRKRYADAEPAKFLELPFGAPEKDFDLAGGTSPGERTETWRYIGRGGQDMEAALRTFAGALGGAQVQQFRLELIGTSYAFGSRVERTMAPILQQSLPAGTVTEDHERIGYLEALRKLKEASRLVLFGSDDPGYTASKLYNYILARRPLLVICREESSTARIVRETKAGELMTFGEEEVRSGGRIRPEWKQAMGRWLEMDPAKEPVTDWHEFQPYTARKMTERLCRFFNKRAVCPSKSV
jgi:hypothetical protein